MKQKPALFISTILSVFILAVLAAVISFTATPAAAETNNDQAVAQALAEQEAAYSQLIADANQQLAQAQSVIDSLSNQDQAPASSAVEYGISADEAVALASRVAQGDDIPNGDPELVNFQGAVAYEVVFDGGNVYIDAVSGQLLLNGTVEFIPADITPERAAQLAANYMGDTKIYRVELQNRGGQLVYSVRFVSGDEVFVSIKGELLEVRLADTVQANNNPSTQTYVEREDNDHDEYEEHDDD